MKSSKMAWLFHVWSVRMRGRETEIVLSQKKEIPGWLLPQQIDLLCDDDTEKCSACNCIIGPREQTNKSGPRWSYIIYNELVSYSAMPDAMCVHNFLQPFIFQGRHKSSSHAPIGWAAATLHVRVAARLLKLPGLTYWMPLMSKSGSKVFQSQKQARDSLSFHMIWLDLIWFHSTSSWDSLLSHFMSSTLEVQGQTQTESLKLEMPGSKKCKMRSGSRTSKSLLSRVAFFWRAVPSNAGPATLWSSLIFKCGRQGLLMQTHLDAGTSSLLLKLANSST